MLQRGERFLVGRRADHKPAAGYWTQVSGTMEAGETQQQTLQREALEEIGCKVRPQQHLQSLPSANGKFLLHYWRVELLEGEPRICDDELTDLRWVTVAELRALQPVFEEDIELFTRLLAQGS